MSRTASANAPSYTRVHEATRCRLNETQGMTTMTNIQTNQIEALSDANLDEVAGGFRLDIFEGQVGNILSRLHHPIAERGAILQGAKAIFNNLLGNFDN